MNQDSARVMNKLPDDVIENIQALRTTDQNSKFIRERNTVYGAGFFEKQSGFSMSLSNANTTSTSHDTSSIHSK